MFGEEIDVDKNAMQLLRSSLFTNSLDSVGRIGQAAVIVPEASVMYLTVAAKKSTSKSQRSPSYCMTMTFEALKDVISKVDKVTGRKRAAGDSLEVVGMRWLQMRLAFVCQTASKDNQVINFGTLFALNGDNWKQFDILLPTTDDYFEDCKLPSLDQFIGEDKKNKEFFKAFNSSITFNPSKRFMIYKSAEKQAWDCMITTYRNIGGQNVPFIIFVEFKSKNIVNTSTTAEVKDVDVYPQDLRQYKRILERVEYVKQQPGEMSEACNALARGHFAYVHFSTTSEKTHEDDIKTEEESGGKLFIMNRQNVRSFLGPVYPFYEVARKATMAMDVNKSTKTTEV